MMGSPCSINLYGCGNMARAIFLGLKDFPHNFTIHAYTPSYTRAEQLALALGGKAYREIKELPQSKYYFFAVKPQQFGQLSQDIFGHLPLDCVVISVMAGVGITHLQRRLGVSRVVRVMPNTPCRVGMGISLMNCSEEVTQDEICEVQSLFERVSTVVSCATEDELDRVMSVSACGPAYLFELAVILSDYLQSHGMSEGTAHTVVKKLFMGSSSLMDHCSAKTSLEYLCNQVTSKGGATEEALAFLRKKKWGKQLKNAMDMAYLRAKELSKDS